MYLPMADRPWQSATNTAAQEILAQEDCCAGRARKTLNLDNKTLTFQPQGLRVTHPEDLTENIFRQRLQRPHSTTRHNTGWRMETETRSEQTKLRSRSST